MDLHSKKILTEKGQKHSLSLDKAFKSAQDKVGLVFGPLSTLWDFLEKERYEAQEYFEQSQQNLNEGGEENQEINENKVRQNLH